ncbi:hypothetical protein SALBM311S_06644 [Streptomyces alboniger]
MPPGPGGRSNSAHSLFSTDPHRRAYACCRPRVAGPPAREYHLAPRLKADTVSQTVPSPVRSTTKDSSPHSG